LKFEWGSTAQAPLHIHVITMHHAPHTPSPLCRAIPGSILSRSPPREHCAPRPPGRVCPRHTSCAMMVSAASSYYKRVGGIQSSPQPTHAPRSVARQVSTNTVVCVIRTGRTRSAARCVSVELGDGLETRRIGSTYCTAVLSLCVRCPYDVQLRAAGGAGGNALQFAARLSWTVGGAASSLLTRVWVCDRHACIH
jgi:hypothetical protein